MSQIQLGFACYRGTSGYTSGDCKNIIQKAEQEKQRKADAKRKAEEEAALEAKKAAEEKAAKEAEEAKKPKRKVVQFKIHGVVHRSNSQRIQYLVYE